MQTPELKHGDVVSLKSGSPKMTIDKIDEEYITCTYYNPKSGEINSEVFKRWELKKAK